MQRRSFIASILAAGVAPAVVGSSILMPVRKVLVDEPGRLVIGQIRLRPPFAHMGLDLANAGDVGIISSWGRGSAAWHLVEISIVDASDWAPDDPCRIPADMSFADFHLGKPFAISIEKPL